MNVWEKAAEQEEILVPIRILIEQDGHKYRDDFTWNLNESLLTPEKFAEILCFDNKLPAAKFAPIVAESIRTQLNEFIPHVPTTDAEELRILIKLDLTIGDICLIDQFEWDLNNPRNSPEQFAEIMATELGLSNEFKVRIAHTIREQVTWFVYQLRLSGQDPSAKEKISNPELIASYDTPPPNYP